MTQNTLGINVSLLRTSITALYSASKNDHIDVEGPLQQQYYSPDKRDYKVISMQTIMVLGKEYP